MSKHLFFSYRRSQLPVAQLLLAWVKEARGPTATFLDVDDIKKGESWAERIESELVRCSGVIVVIDDQWDPAKVIGNGTSQPGLDLDDWMSRELFIAHLLKRQILPVYLPNTDPAKLHVPNELAFLKQLQHVDIRSNETLREQFDAEILPWTRRLPHSPSAGDAIDGIAVVKAILENLHQSLKWLWQFLMAVAYVHAFYCVGSAFSDQSPTTESFVAAAVTLLSFVGCFLRFYLGDGRYLDLSYLETAYQRGLEAEINKFSPTKRFMDVLLLMSVGGSFFLMSFFLVRPEPFLFAFEVLMVVNIFWLSYNCCGVEVVTAGRTLG